MAESEHTTVRLLKSTRNQLLDKGTKGESYDAIIQRLLTKE